MLAVGGTAIVGSGVTIAIVVALTPLSTTIPSGEEAITDSNVGQAASISQQVAEPTGSLQASSQLEFPSQAAPIDAEQLQQELLALAQTLETDFANAPLALHLTGQIYHELKQTELAEAAWRKCLEQGCTAAGPYAGLAQLLISRGRDAEAIDILETAHANGTQSGETLRELAEAQENLGLLSEAKSTLDTALELDTEDAEAWLAHGRVLMQLEAPEMSEASILKNIQLSGESEKALLALSTAQARQRKMAQAEATRQRLVKRQAENPLSTASFQEIYNSSLRKIAVELFLSYSAFALENQRIVEAERSAWRSIELEPGSGRAYVSLLAVQRAQGELLDAYATAQHLVAIQSDNPLNYVNLASLATQLGKVSEAKQALIQAIELDPSGFVARYSLVRLHLALEEFPEAERHANTILEHHRSVEAYILLAHVLEAAGEPDAAAQAIRQARLLAPDHPAWNPQQGP